MRGVCTFMSGVVDDWCESETGCLTSLALEVGVEPLVVETLVRTNGPEGFEVSSL